MIVEWSQGSTDDGIVYHNVSRQTEITFSQTYWRADWGTWYFATDDGANTTYQSGVGQAVQRSFDAEGKLNNTGDPDFRAIGDNTPVFALAVDIGLVTELPKSVLFSVGMTQSDAAQYTRKSGGTVSTDILPPLWKSYFADDLAAVSFFHLVFHICSHG